MFHHIIYIYLLSRKPFWYLLFKTLLARFFAVNSLHLFCFVEFSYLYRTNPPFFLGGTPVLAPLPKLGNHTHRTHFNLYAAHLQGSIRALGGKFVGSLSLRWQDFERHWDVKKKRKLLVGDVYFWKIIIMAPIYKEKTYYIVIYIYKYIYLQGCALWKSLKLDYPSQIQCKFDFVLWCGKNLENKNPCSVLFEGAFLGGIDVFW